MTISHNALKSIAILVAIALFALMAPFDVHANPSQVAPSKETASATTSLVYMTPGTATTTLTYDSYSTDATKFDKLTLAIQYTASTTGPTLKLRLEDSPNGVDWYPRAGVTNAATTTTLTGAFSEYSWPVATTTDNGGSGTSARIHTSLTVESPMRYVRSIFYVPASGGNGGLWAQFLPIRETPSR